MGIFSSNIIEEPWVGMAYKLANCTNPRYMDTFWHDAFRLNLSRKKLKNKLRELMIRENGTMKLTGDDFAEINKVMEVFSIKNIDEEYKYIILLCLVVPTIDKLCPILNSCLVDSKLNKSHITVTVEKVNINSLEVFDSLYITIKINTVTPQKLEIILSKK